MSRRVSRYQGGEDVTEKGKGSPKEGNGCLVPRPLPNKPFTLSRVTTVSRITATGEEIFPRVKGVEEKMTGSFV